MNNSFFPDIAEYSDNHITSSEYKLFQYDAIKTYFNKILSNWSIVDYFESHNINRIALYSITGFTDAVIKDLHNHNKDDIIECICDKYRSETSEYYCGIKLVSIQSLSKIYKKEELKIIQCNIVHHRNITLELIKNGIEFDDIIPISHAIYD